MVWIIGTAQLDKKEAVKVKLMQACLGAFGQDDVFDTFELPDDVSLVSMSCHFGDYRKPRSKVVVLRIRSFRWRSNLRCRGADLSNCSNCGNK